MQALPTPPAPVIATAPFGSNVNAVTFGWWHRAGISLYRVRYRVFDDRQDWRTHNNAIPPPSSGNTITHKVDGIWDCRELYEIEVRGEGDASTFAPRFGDPLTVTHSPLCPLTIGHQKDNTVSWKVGRYPPATPPTPLPPHMEDPRSVFNTGILRGTNGWNHVTICKNCSSNTDQYHVTVNDGDDDDCGDSIACVHFDPLDDAGTSRTPHMTNMEMQFEHPGYGFGNTVYWTLHSAKNNTAVPGEIHTKFYYIGAYAAHEFGHTIHVDNFEGQGVFEYMRGVMRDPGADHSPTTDDNLHVEAIYRNHTAHR